MQLGHVLSLVLVLAAPAQSLVTGIWGAEAWRDTWQRPDVIVAALALHPGSVVADVGAGEGYLLTRLSSAVGPTGQVYALEQAGFLPLLAARITAEHLGNVTPLVYTDPLPVLDAALLLHTYEVLLRRRETLERLFLALRPGGRLVIVDGTDREVVARPWSRIAETLTGLGFRVTRVQPVFAVSRPDPGLVMSLIVGVKP